MLAPVNADIGLQLRVLRILPFCLFYGIFLFALLDLPQQGIGQVNIEQLRETEQEEEDIGKLILNLLFNLGIRKLVLKSSLEDSF